MTQYKLWESDQQILKNSDISKLYHYDSKQKDLLIPECDTPSKEYYLYNMKRYFDSNPLLAFEYLLEGASCRVLSQDKIDHSKYLYQLIYKVATGKDDISGLTWDNLLRLNYWKSKNTQRSVARLLLRVISSDCIDLIRDENKVARLVDFFHMTIPDIGKVLKVDISDQNFEQMKSWSDYGKDVMELRNQVDYNDVGSFTQKKDILKKTFSLLQRHYFDFVLFEGLGDFIDGVIDTINNYRSGIRNGLLDEAEYELNRIEDMLKKAVEKDSTYIRVYILPILENMLIDYKNNKNLFNLPSRLSLVPFKRAYPFSDKDAVIVLKLYLINEGGGFAHDINLSLEFDNHVFSKETGNNRYLYYIQKLGPGRITIDIPIVLGATGNENIQAMSEIGYWTWEKQENEQSFIDFEFETRKVDWDKFNKTQHYSITPLVDDTEFAGKENRINPILANVSTNRGSAWLYGYKRTGKTSTANAVERNIKDLDSFITAFCTSGDYFHHQPDKMIDQMVKTLTTKLCHNGNIKYIKPGLNGTLTPLIDIIDEIHISTGKNIFFVIDEFDEIHYELYKANPLSYSFWLPLRAISMKEHASFLLVGGENIQHLKATWGSKLNLLQTYKSHKFTAAEWEEYKILVTTPVKDSLEFSEEALRLLREMTDGNPFFTKLLCISIGSNAGKRRNAFVGHSEVTDAITGAIEDGLQMDHFQHIIDDGIISKDQSLVGRKDERIQFLLAMIKCHYQSLHTTIENCSNNAQAIGLSATTFKILLNEFKERELITVEDDLIRLTMPIFDRYLRRAGEVKLGKLLSQEHEIQRIEAELKMYEVKNTEIMALLKQWGTYKAKEISMTVIQSWLDQFADSEERRKVFEFLKMIRFISIEDIMNNLKVAYEYAIQNVTFKKGRKKSKRDDIFVTYIDGEGKSGAMVASYFVEVNQILKRNIIGYTKLQQLAEDKDADHSNMNVLVIVDDFIGSGKSMTDELKSNRDILKRISDEYNAKIIVYIAFAMEVGRDSVINLISKSDYEFIELFVGETFDESEKIFSDSSRYYSNGEERERMRSILIEHYGRMVDYNRPSGYEGTQVGIVFPSNCPNNSIPILWKNVDKENKKWSALFPRSFS